MNNRSYYQDSQLNRAAVYLTFFSRDQVEDIIALVNSKQSSLINTLFNTEDEGGSGVALAPMAVLSKQFVKSDSLEDVALGLATIYMEAIRKPRKGQDEYEQVLMNAFTIPQTWARSLAKDIETLDFDSNQDDAWYKKFWDNTISKARVLVNAIPGASLMGWEIDQNQNHDYDLLYEFAQLGEAVRKLAKRAELMKGQARLESLGTFQMGDPSDPNDVSGLGDVITAVNAKRVPGKAMVRARFIKIIGDLNQRRAAQALLRQSGYNVSEKGDVQETAHSSKVGKLLTSIDTANPIKTGIIGALLGLTPGIISLIRGSKGDEGDPYSEPYGYVEDAWGPEVALAMGRGDVEGVIHALDEQYHGNGALETTGDPILDEQITADVMSELGDSADDLSPEIGGWFRRMKINKARRQARRRTRRAARKAARQSKKMSEIEALRQAQREAELAGSEYSADGSGPESAPDFSPHDGDSQQFDEGSSSAYTDPLLNGSDGDGGDW